MTPEDALVDALAQSAFVTIAALNRVCSEHDLSLTQLRVLGILRDRRLRMTALAAHLGLEKSTLTGLVDRAEKRGLLQRVRNVEDGRAFDVELTEQGHALAATLTLEVRRALAPATAQLATREKDRLRWLLLRVQPVGGWLADPANAP